MSRLSVGRSDTYRCESKAIAESSWANASIHDVLTSVVAAPDKFRGTASAPVIAAAIAAAVTRLGGCCMQRPMADGGEGLLDILGGGNRVTRVTGPLGDAVDAEWRLESGRTAVIESALACGLHLVGGASRNDPIGATTFGVGELIRAVYESGARRLLVGLGGSATTDGGAGALAALQGLSTDLRSVEILVCCDVRTRFTEAAAVFGPQKGASPDEVFLLTQRLRRIRLSTLAARGIDLDDVPGSGAAGGLAGGLLSVGAQLVSGFDTVAELVGLDASMAGASLVVTGEGRLDAASFTGKVVGGVVEQARRHSVPTLVVAGSVDPDVALPSDVHVIDMTCRFGTEKSHTDTAACVAQSVNEFLSRPH